MASGMLTRYEVAQIQIENKQLRAEVKALRQAIEEYRKVLQNVVVSNCKKGKK